MLLDSFTTKATKFSPKIILLSNFHAKNRKETQALEENKIILAREKKIV